MVRVWSGEHIPAPHFNLNLASSLPLFNLFLTSFVPHLNPCSDGNLEPRFGNNGLQTLTTPQKNSKDFPSADSVSPQELSENKETHKKTTKNGVVQKTKILKPGNTKKYEEITKSPHPGLDPQTTKMKYRKITKWPENAHFLNFSIFLWGGGGLSLGWGILYFFVFFRISRLEGFLFSVPPQGDLKRRRRKGRKLKERKVRI